MNIFARYFGFHLIEHFPCSFDCKATVQLGDRLLGGLQHYELHYAHELARMLAAPILHAGADGVYMFPGGEWEESGAFRYSSMLASLPHSDLSRRLSGLTVVDDPAARGRWMTFPEAA
jgi:hypothetical protein